MNTKTPQQNFIPKIVAWITYGFVFAALTLVLLFQTSFTSYGLFTQNQSDLGHIQAGYWYGAASVIALACSTLIIFLKQRRAAFITAIIYTVAIIFTAIIGPSYIVHTDFGQFSLRFFTFIPWFLVWLSIAAMWLLASSKVSDASKPGTLRASKSAASSKK